MGSGSITLEMVGGSSKTNPQAIDMLVSGNKIGSGATAEKVP